MPDNNILKILFFGDIVGRPGRHGIKKIFSELKIKYSPDITLANAENLAHGAGVTKKTFDEIRQTGIDLFTSGNHIWKKSQVYEMFEDPDIPLIRPANYINSPGQGYKIINSGNNSILVINIQGNIFMSEEVSSPFEKITEILKDKKNEKLAAIIVDFHAEATSEKIAMGWFLDGKVSAVLGTHTHVPTADEIILPNRTAYQTDIGMVGLKNSVLGVDKDIIINNFLSKDTIAHEIPEHGICIINSTLLEIDSNTGKAIKITRVSREIEV